MEAKEEKQREIEKSQIKVGWGEGHRVVGWSGAGCGGACDSGWPPRCVLSHTCTPAPPHPPQAKSKMSKAEKQKQKKEKAKSFNQAAAPAKAAKNAKRWN